MTIMTNQKLSYHRETARRTLSVETFPTATQLYENHVLVFTLPFMVGCVAQLVERRSLTGELSLSHARPAADG